MIEFAVKNDSGGFYFGGRRNGNKVVGSMGFEGKVNWTRKMEFIVRDITTYKSSNGEIHLVCAGGRDYNNRDGKFEEGRIAILNTQGDNSDDKSILDPSCDIWLNGIEICQNESLKRDAMVA